ncbi:MAG: HAMP domain-containing sensor histidine kinase [Bacteroidota bacterium]
MSQRVIYAIITLMTLTVLGLAVLQWSLIRKSVAANSEQFDHVVRDALQNAAEVQESREKTMINIGSNGYNSALGGIPSITERNLHNEISGSNPLSIPGQRLNIKPEDRYANWPLAERVDLEQLDNSLRTALEEGGVDTRIQYGVYSNDLARFVIRDGRKISEREGNPERHTSLLESSYKVVLFDNRTGEGPGTLYLNFPHKETHIWSSLYRILILTAILISMILACFAYAILTILRQKRLSRMKTDFINNMTHEFKTPIATISLAVDSINNPKISGKPEKVERFANIIKQENKRMNKQVEKVLQMARLDRRKLNLKLSLVNLHELIDKAVENISLQVEPRGGSVSTNLQAENATIEGDQTHLANIFNNLLDNANKYSPEAPKIIVSSVQLDKGISVTITDRGIGMSKDARKHIFDAFYRVSTGNRHDVKGFGLGLSYVKNIAEVHGGSVKVKSELGKGSSFTVFLPYRQPAN